MARTPNKTLNWDSRIGRRIRLHDLHAFATVVQLGSISKAAVKLGVTQSAISQMIADLEATLRARLLDRSTRGVASTLFGMFFSTAAAPPSTNCAMAWRKFRSSAIKRPAKCALAAPSPFRQL